MIRKVILKIKRKENRFYKALYKVAVGIRGANFPCIKVVHLPLYYMRNVAVATARGLKHFLWDVPLFKSRCRIAGKGLCLPNGQPLVLGDLEIELGENVTIMRTTLGASKVFERPILRIGNNARIGYGTVVSVSKEVTIGSDTLIGTHCLIMDSDDHPMEPEARRAREPVSREEVSPVKIGNNVWLGTRVVILKGTTIGDNSVIGANSLVSKDVPANCVAIGFPARVVKSKIDVKGLWGSK